MRVLSLLALVPLIGLGAVRAQDDVSFTKGSVYEVRLIQTEAHSQEDYLSRLKTFYLPVMRKAQQEGLIKSFKVLAGASSNEDDFDILLLVEHTSMAMFDPDPAREAKWDAIEKEMIGAMGGPDKRKAFNTGLAEIRKYKGEKYMREMIPK